ncbi:hypothetical protein WOLCODRAFT_124554 [Wolfiporia cocos MD-104 SS10]|uniref:MYND-type domain-containing protein n=1 Tax=Wolfiporia cocos (strain MD-104) TaxID=742152 RepID=A0A2H3K4N1_WOLCO|nr:hypothetical protein WOLCODRAFT_124554 [Wolfiporia cocos MD-104 SS10]
MANLHDRLAFPTFEDCPGEYDVTPRYWKDSNGDDFFKRVRHWCFLGEIVDILTLPRLFLTVRDILGNKALAAFHTDDAGRGLLRTGNVKEGHTFALLDAQQHLFFSGHIGFRIEHPGLAKIIPCSMDHLLKANDKLQSVPSGCWAPGCGKDTDATTCNGCGIAKYCGQEHQQLGWKQGHKQECKAFAELKWFLQRDWSTFHNDFFF